MTNFHFFTLLHGTDPSAMQSHHAVLKFSNVNDAHRFALLAARTAVKNGATKADIDVVKKVGQPPVLQIRTAR